MKRRINTLPEFDRASKRLRKKFRSLKGELIGLASQILADYRVGQSLGAGLYKIRLARAAAKAAASALSRIMWSKLLKVKLSIW